MSRGVWKKGRAGSCSSGTDREQVLRRGEAGDVELGGQAEPEPPGQRRPGTREARGAERRAGRDSRNPVSAVGRATCELRGHRPCPPPEAARLPRGAPPLPGLPPPTEPPAPPSAQPGPRLWAPFLAVRPAPRQRLAMAGPGPRPAKGYRVVLLGSVAVGKTALATQFACGSFPEECEPSVEELFSKVIEVNAAPALLEIVDTVGAEHLVTLKDLYIKNSDGFVVLYSVCSEASFEAVRPLRERMGRLRGPKAVPLVLVGTKADLDAERQVLTARGRALAREWRCPFLEVTAKSKLMVDQVFTQVVREMEALAPPEEEVRAVPTNAQDTWPAERFIG